MSSLTGVQLVGDPFAVWAATLQVMPGGVLDASFGRFFVGARIRNGGSAVWPSAHARLSQRSRQQLCNVGIVVDDHWSASDAAAFDQQLSGDAVVVPALAGGASRTIFFKLDSARAIAGVHDFELEVFDAATGGPISSVRGPLRVIRTSFDAHSQSFTTDAEGAKLTTSIANAAFDVEALRRALARARAAFPAGPASGGSASSRLGGLRARLGGFLCGENDDICGIFSEVEAFCALPPGPSVPPGSIPGLEGFAVFGAQSVNLADRVRVTAGNAGSNLSVVLGVEGFIAGNVLAGGNITLRNKAVVSGSATANGTVEVPATADVIGPVTEHAPYVAVAIPTRTVSVGSQNITLSSGSRTLEPGSYGVVQTTGPVTLAFRAGVYHFRRLSFGPDAVLSLNVSAGLIDVRALEQLAFGDRTSFSVSGGPSGGRVSFYSDQSDVVRLGTDIPTFTGSVSAPKGTIQQFSRTKVSGALWGKSVSIEPDCSVALAAGPGQGEGWLGKGASGFELAAYPTALDCTLEHRDGYLGTKGPLAFDAVPWETLIANVNLSFNLVLGQLLASALAATAGGLVIGKVKAAVLDATANPPPSAPLPTAAGSVDAAVVSLVGNRSLGSPPFQQLDAQHGEPNARAVTRLGSRVVLPGTWLTNAEITTLIAGGAADPTSLQVYESGASTGLTRGLLSALIPVFARPEGTLALHFTNQLLIVPDPAFPSAGASVAGQGDSGSLWVHANTGKLIGLTHAVSEAGAAVASRIQDVLVALGARLS